MAQIVEVPGYGQVEFPDGMNDAAIVAAIKRIGPAPQAQPSASPADGVGPLQAGLIAAGRSTDKIVQGVRQLYNKAIGDQSTLDKMAAAEAEKDRAYAPLAEAHPIATGIGEAAPAAAVPLGGGALGLVAKSALAGAAPGVLSYGSLAERLQRGGVGMIGGGIGGGLGLGVSRLLRPAGSAVQGLSNEATGAAERLGFNLSPGQSTQNPALQNFENYLAKSPGSSGAMQARASANQNALNAAAAKAMGQSTPDLSEGAFAAAKQGIGAEFERLQSVTNPQIGNDFLNTLAQIDAANAARGPFKSQTIDGLIDKGLDLAAKGNLSGPAYKEIRTQISRDAQSAFQSGDATLGQALKSMRKALDDAAKASLGKADQEAWDTTRAQWAAYKALAKSNVSEAGNVSPARLAAAIRQQGDGLRTGAAKGPLADIARLGEAVKGVQNPNSGQLTQQMIYGNPLTGVPMLLGNKMMGGLYNAPIVQRYMTKGLLGIGPGTEAAIGKLSLPLGAPLARQYLGVE